MQRSLFLVLLLSLASVSGFASAQSEGPADLQAAATAAAADGADSAAHIEHGRLLVRSGDLDAARQAFNRAKRLDRRGIAPLWGLASVAFASGDYQASRQACRPIERKGRNAVIARVCRARTFLVWDRASRAFEELEAALAEAPNDFEARLALGEAHARRGSRDEAMAAFRAAATIDAASPRPHVQMGLFELKSGQRAAATPHFRAALERDGNDPDALRELALTNNDVALATRAVASRDDSASRLALGRAQLSTGDSAAAVTTLRALTARDTESAPAHGALAQALFAAGELEPAEASARRAIEIVPNDFAANLLVGDILARRGEANAAQRQYRHTADLDARRTEPMMRAADLSLSQNRAVSALGFLQRVIQVNPQHAPALVKMGEIMAGRRQHAEARGFYQRALTGQGEIDRAAVQAAMNALPQ